MEWPFVVLYSLESAPWSGFFDVSAFTTAKFDAHSPLADRGIRFIPNPYGNSSSPGVFLDSVAESDAFKKSEDIDNQKFVRLLYVIMTRARDYIAFAARSGNVSRLEQRIGLIILQEKSDASKEWNVVPITPDKNEVAMSKKSIWYAYADTTKEHKLAEIQPSALELPEKTEPATLAISQETFCERMKTGGDYEPDALGTAIHRYLAIDVSKYVPAEKKVVAERLLKSYGQESNVQAEELIRAGDALTAWINKKWPDCTLHREWPILLEKDGCMIEGTSDLVVEQAESFAIIDYKTFPGSQKQIAEQAGEYAPQLSAYAEAVEKATAKKCTGLFVCFVVAGVMVEIQRVTFKR